jgi:hypothetical protein
MGTVIDTKAVSGMHFQDFYPGTNNFYLQQLNRVTAKGLNQEQVALFKRIYGKDYFKPTKTAVP